MQKQAPSLGRSWSWPASRCPASACCCSCGSPSAARSRSSPRATASRCPSARPTQLAQEADVRISGVSVGKVKDIDPDKPTGRSDATIQLDPATRRCRGHQGDPAPEDAAGRDLRRADARLAERRHDPRERPAARPAQVADTSSSTRSSARSTPRRATRSRSGCRPSPQSLDGPRPRHSTTRWATSRRSPRTRPSCCEILNAQQADVRRLVRNTGEVFDALSERDGQLRGADQELQPRLRDDRGAQRRAPADLPARCRRSSASRR